MEPKVYTLADLAEEFVEDATRRYEERQNRPPQPPLKVKVYRRHYCEKKHKAYATMAKCLWKWAYWITGEGPYALLAWCRVLTITLHPSLESAAESKERIDTCGCGGMCRNVHEIVQMVPPSEALTDLRFAKGRD